MKKVLFAAIAVCGFVAANAQLSESKVSSATNTLAGSVTSDFNLKLKVYNVIRIIPNTNFDMSATFNSASDLDGTKNLNIGLPDAFIVSSNRKFHVNMSAGAVTVQNNLGGAGGNSSMPLSVFGYRSLTTPGSGVALTSDDWQTLGATQPIASGDAGVLRGFGLQFRATPGWNYEGGNYNVPITVTATQD